MLNENIVFHFGGDDDVDDDENEEQLLMNLDLCDRNVRSELLAKRPSSCGVLTFYNGTEEALLCFVERNATRGDPMSVLKAIDLFCYSRQWMMHCGNMKLKYLEYALQKSRSKRIRQNKLVCVEIGSYCGYSTVLIASKLNQEANEHELLYCIEADSKCRKWTARMLSLAGLSDKVRIVDGISSVDTESISSLKDILITHHGSIDIDFMFIDHDKSRYLDDLMIFESMEMLRTGSVVVADNVLSFGQPLWQYLDHVRNASRFIPLATSIDESGLDTIEQQHDEKQIHDDLTAKNTDVDGNILLVQDLHFSSELNTKNSPLLTIIPSESNSIDFLNNPVETETAARFRKNTNRYLSSELFKCYLEYSCADEYCFNNIENNEEDEYLDGIEVSIFN